ncbi:hypothetical protein L7F22_054152 [Adiantum nelumboides]|nr:hypothetical protein [Adiantum nelumboides]
MGPLPRTANGKLYILVAIDYTTRFGTPLEIVSDNGLGFRKGLLTEVCEELNTSHRHSTPYYPQSNGLVEKANGIIACIIKKMVESKPKRWDNFLDGAIYAYRTTYGDATQFIPLHLVYGQEILQPIELNIPTIKHTGRQEQNNDEAWFDRLLSLVELEWKREEAYHCYERKALQLKDKLNEGLKDKEIKEKSLVLRCNNALDNRFDAKFERRWEGPFIVKKAFTGGYCQLMDLDGKEHPRKVNGYRFKPYLSCILPAVFETKQVSKKTKKLASSCQDHCETYCQAIKAPLGPDSGVEKMQIDECPPPERAKATDAFSPNFLRLYYGSSPFQTCADGSHMETHLAILMQEMCLIYCPTDMKHPGCDSSYLGRCKFSFTLEDDIYVRYLSNHSANEMESSIREKCPYKMDIGAVYNLDPTKRTADSSSTSEKVFAPIERELVFYVDMTHYDDVGFCCTGLDICHKCWPLMTIAIKVVDTALREDFGFEHILWSLQALEKRSHEHPTACLRAGVLLAVLLYLDFFSTGVQRGAVSTAANIYRQLSSNAFEFVIEVVLILKNLLQYQYLKVVDHASVCLSRMQEIAIADARYELRSLLHLMAMLGLSQANSLLSRVASTNGYQPKVIEALIEQHWSLEECLEVASLIACPRPLQYV